MVDRNPADAPADRTGIGLGRIPREPVLGPAVEAANELVPLGGYSVLHTRPDAAAGVNLRSLAGPLGSASRLDVAVDLRHQLGLAAERLLVAQALPELE